MPFDLSYTLFFVSLGVSAVAVVIFLWLMRDEAGGVKRQTEGERSTPKRDDEAPRLPPEA